MIKQTRPPLLGLELRSQPCLVSVIIIFLDAEKFIQSAVESVLGQTFDNWELLLVDDGSKDCSTAFARSLVQSYPGKISYLEHEGHHNKGMSASRNLGLAQARGEYIAFLDADDIWPPRKLQQQLTLLEAYPEAAMTYGRMRLWHSWTGRKQDASEDRFLDLGVPPDRLIAPPELFINAWTGYYQTPGTGNALIRSRVLKKLGGFEEQFRGWGEDRAFFAKLQLSEPIYVCDEVWLYYRQHPHSNCHRVENSLERNSEALTQVVRWLESYLRDQGVEGGEAWNALQAFKAKPRFRFRNNRLYHVWTLFLEFALRQGRKALPAQLRRWIWQNLVRHVYG